MDRFSIVARCAVTIATLALLGACASVGGDWDSARKLDQIGSYQSFLRKYPQSEYTAPAQARIEELEWERARRADRIEVLEKYLEDKPGSRFRAQAQERLAALHGVQYEAARKLGTVDGYEEYIKKYPKGPHLGAATASLEQLMWAQASQGDTLRSYKTYRARFPAGPHSAEAEGAVAARKATALQAESWQRGEAQDSCRWTCQAKACVDDLDKTLWSKVAEGLKKVVGQAASLAVAYTQDGQHSCSATAVRGTPSVARSSCTDRASGRTISYATRIGEGEQLSTNRIDPGAAGRWARDCD